VSGSDVGRSPLTDPQWARDMEARVRHLESSSVTRVGSWTLVEREEQLLAVKPGEEIALDGNPIREDVSQTLRGYATGVALTNTNNSVQTVRDNQVQGWTGDMTVQEAPDANVLGAVSQVYSMILRNNAAIADINAAINAQGATGGKLLTVRYADYPDGPLPAVFTVTYSGPGASTVGVAGKVAGWAVAADSLSRDVTLIYTDSPTDTDIQVVRATMSSPPGTDPYAGTARYWLIGRSNLAGTRFVFARIYKVFGFIGYGYEIQVGYLIDGVETLVHTESNLVWSPDFFLRCGVGASQRAFEVWYDGLLLYQFTDSAAISMLGAAYRYWGDRREVRQVDRFTADSGSTSVNSGYDDAPATLAGPAARMYRTAAGFVPCPVGTAALPAAFFGIIDYSSPDIIASPAAGSFIITRQGSYAVHGRLMTSGGVQIGLMINNVLARYGQPGTGTSAIGDWSVPLQAGDVASLCTIGSSGSFLTGEVTGTQTYFTITAEALSFL
jgi:hypothetical protein